MDSIIYEHPLNEKVRNYLRQEHLLILLRDNAYSNSESAAFCFFDALFNIIELLERSDTKNDLLKDLEKHENALVQWSKHPGVDNSALEQLLGQVVRIVPKLKQSYTQLQQLKEDKFLASVKQRMNIPGGHCNFDLPNLHYWRHLEQESRNKDVERWLSIIIPFEEAIGLCLKFLREKGEFLTQQANAGFYQESAEGLELLRIQTQPKMDYYPTVSGNKYRYAIRFMSPCPETGRTSVEENIPFKLACC